MLSQLPGGAAVDALRSKRLAAAGAAAVLLVALAMPETRSVAG